MNLHLDMTDPWQWAALIAYMVARTVLNTLLRDGVRSVKAMIWPNAKPQLKGDEN